MKRIIPFILIFLFSSGKVFSQELSAFISESAFGNVFIDAGVDVDVDSEGNLIVYGYFEETVDFDLTDGELEIEPHGAPDLFLAKYTDTGNLLWVVNLGRIGLTDGMLNGEMEVDADDNILITGAFASTVNFNPLGDVNTRTSSGGEDAFIAKYNPQGQAIWVKQIGSVNTETATSLDVRNDGAIAFGLRFSNLVDVDPGDGETILTSGGALDGAVIALDTNGDYLFSHQYTSPGNDNVTSVKFAADGKLAVGSLINGSASGFPDRDMQLSYHQNNGDLIWAYNFSNFDDANEVSDILFSNDELSIYIGGRINGTTDFNTDPESEEIIDPLFADPFVAKYSLDGDLEWVKHVNSAGTDDYFAGMTESGSAVITVGSFDVLATFDEGDFTTQKPSAGGRDIFIASYNKMSGDYIKADVYGGAGDEYPVNAVFSESGSFFCTGSYSGNLNLNPQGVPIENNGFTDVFISEFSYQTSLSDSQNGDILGGVKVFPNPVSNALYLKLPPKVSVTQLHYKVINVVGQVVKEGYFDPGVPSTELDLSSLNKGIFILELIAGKDRISKRLVKH